MPVRRRAARYAEQIDADILRAGGARLTMMLTDERARRAILRDSKCRRHATIFMPAGR